MNFYDITNNTNNIRDFAVEPECRSVTEMIASDLKAINSEIINDTMKNYELPESVSWADLSEASFNARLHETVEELGLHCDEQNEEKQQKEITIKLKKKQKQEKTGKNVQVGADGLTGQQRRTLQKYTKLSGGKKILKHTVVAKELRDPPVLNLSDLNEFPCLGSNKNDPGAFESELAKKSQTWPKKKMVDLVEKVTLEKCVNVDIQKQQSRDPYEHFKEFYEGVLKKKYLMVYNPEGSGFVLFRASAIRYVLSKIAVLGNDGDARKFLEAVITLSDEEFSKVIGSWLDRYSIEPQAWFEVSVNHKMNQDSVDMLSSMMKSLVAGTQTSAADVGKGFGEGLLSSFNLGGLIPKEIIGGVKKFVTETLGVDFKCIVLIVGCGSFLSYVQQNGLSAKTVAAAAFIAYAVMMLGGFQKEGQSFFSAFNETSESDGLLEAQGYDPDTVSEVVSLLMTGFIFKGEKKDVKGFAKSIKGFSLMRTDTSSIVQTVVSLMQKFGDYLSQNYCEFNYFNFLSDELPGLERWIDDMNTLVREQMEGRLPMTTATANRILELERRGQDLYGKSCRSGNRHIEMRIRPILSNITRLRSKYETAGIFQNGARQMPVMIMLRGNSQIGKTRLLRPMLARLIGRCLPERREQLKSDFNSLIYNFNEDTEHWDGYYGQVAMTMDEYSVMKKPPGEVSAHTAVIKIKNSFPYMLEMADLASKGSTYFRSQFIVATTNIRNVYVDAKTNLNYPIALCNRIDLDCEVHVKREYATERTRDLPPWERKLDKAKIPKNGGKFFWGLHEIYLMEHHMIGNEYSTTSSGPYNIEQIMNMAEAKFRHYANESEEDRHIVNSIIDSCEEELFAQAGDDDSAETASFYQEASEAGDEPRFNIHESYTYARAHYEGEWTGQIPTLNVENLVLQLSEQRVPIKDVYISLMRQCNFDHIEPGYVIHISELLTVFHSASVREHVLGACESNSRVHRLLINLCCISPPMIGFMVTREWDQVCRMMEVIERRASYGEDLETTLSNSAGLPSNDHLLASLSMLLNNLRVHVRVGMKKVYGTDVVYQAIEWLWKCVSRFIGTLWILYFCVTVIKAILNGLKTIIMKIWHFFVPPDESEKDEKKEKVKQVVPVAGDGKGKERGNIPPLKEGALEAQSDFRDLECQNIVQSIYRKNLFKFIVAGHDRGYGVFIKGNLFLMNRHFIDIVRTRSQEGAVVELIGVGTGERMEWTREEFLSDAVEAEERDLCLLRLTKMPRLMPDIVDKFVSERDMISRDAGDCVFGRVSVGNPLLITSTFKSMDPVAYYGKWDKSKRIDLKKGYSYPIATQRGECGCLVFMNNPGIVTRKVFGVHSAGVDSGRFGVCSAVSQELLEKMENALDLEAQGGMEFKTMRPIEVGVHPIPGANSRSNIVRSELHGAWRPAIKAPARLKPTLNKEGILVNPFIEAVKGYDMPTKKIPSDFIEVCVRAMFNDLKHGSARDVPFKCQSLEEVVMGRPGEVESLPRSTSCGFPDNAHPRPGWPGKTRYLGIDKTELIEPKPTNTKWDKLGLDLEVLAPDWDILKNRLIEDLDTLDRGGRPLFVYTDSLKDEVLKKEKVDNVQTRLFSGSPISLVILSRMFFGQFALWMTENRLLNGSGVGMNVFSDEWEITAQLLEKYPYQFAGDYKSFDKKQNQRVLEVIGEHICAMYNDEYGHIRKALWREVTHSRHLCGDVIYEWDHSNPSGNALTTHINVLYNGFNWRAVWLLAHDCRVKCLIIFREHIYVVLYGDDVAGALDEYAASKLEEIGVPELMEEIGMTFTSEDKISAFKLRNTLENITFLKRSFRYEPYAGRRICPLALDTVLEMAYWTKRNDSHQITLANIVVTIQELSQHDEATFNEWFPKIYSAVRERMKIHLPVTTRYELLDLLLSNSGTEKELQRMRRKEIMRVLDGGISIAPEGELEEGFTKITKTTKISGKIDKNKNNTKQNTIRNMIKSDIETINVARCKPVHVLLAQGADDQGSSGVKQSNGQDSMQADGLFPADQKQPAVVDSGGTHFDNADEVRIAKIDVEKSLTPSLLTYGRVGFDQGLETFLGKPQLIAHYTLTNQGAGTILGHNDLPAAIFAKSVPQKKATGFLNFRATTVIRVQVNGNKFQQGRLLVHFLPQGQEPGMYPGLRNRSLIGITQQPRVDLDISCDTEATMVIPYVSPTMYYSFADQSGPIGRVYVTVYDPLATGTGGSNSLDISVFGYFKDIELVTPSVLTAQGRDNKPKTRLGRQDEEKEAFGDKPVSAGLAQLSGGFASLAKIPLLSSIASPLSWATSIGSGVAAAFGYDKPAKELSRVMEGKFSASMPNGDGSDSSQCLGLSQTNGVRVLPGFAGTDIDEASLSHLVQIPSWFGTFTWNMSDASGHVVANLRMEPCAFISYGTYGTGGHWQDLPPVSYFSTFFSFWRGSFRLRVKAVKTQYHTGRLLMCFSPRQLSSPSIDDSSYLLREILDFREKSEWEFLIPYCNNREYNLTPSTNLTAYTPQDPMGCVSFLVLNELVGPASVATSVNLLMEISGGPDFELANPVFLEYVAPYMQFQWLTAQGMDDDDGCVFQPTRGIGGSIIDKPTTAAAEYCIGEYITSLYQLLKRPVACGIPDSNGASINTVFSYNVRPFVQWFTMNTDTPPYPTGYPCCDYVGFFAPCFAYSRGGMRLKALNMTTNPETWLCTQYRDSNTTATGLDDTSEQTRPCQPMAANSWSTGIGAEVMVPQYTILHSRLNRPSVTGAPEPTDWYGSNNRVLIAGLTGNDKCLFRSVADDYALGYFIGCPPLAV